MVKPKSKVVVRLAGGLGNQLFQWACGYALAHRTDSELVLDVRSGFLTDFKYRRFYELGPLNLAFREASFWEVAEMYVRWLRSKWSRAKHTELHIYSEQQNEYLDEVIRHPAGINAWLFGYFQSPKYFNDCTVDVRKSLLISEPKYWVYRDLGIKMRNSESVALGIRLYEETKDPAFHAHNGQVISLAKVQKAINEFVVKLGTFDTYIFCTYHADILDQLIVPGSVKFITADDGYSDTWSGLWLLAQCRHHIFSNSSFYWWGAFLSAHYHHGAVQHIAAADNFANQDIYLDEWDTF